MMITITPLYVLKNDTTVSVNKSYMFTLYILHLTHDHIVYVGDVSISEILAPVSAILSVYIL